MSVSIFKTESHFQDNKILKKVSILKYLTLVSYTNNILLVKIRIPKYLLWSFLAVVKLVFVVNTVFICWVPWNYVQNKVLFCMNGVRGSNPDLKSVCMSTHKFHCQIVEVKRPKMLAQPLNKNGKNIQSNAVTQSQLWHFFTSLSYLGTDAKRIFSEAHMVDSHWKLAEWILKLFLQMESEFLHYQAFLKFFPIQHRKSEFSLCF